MNIHPGKERRLLLGDQPLAKLILFPSLEETFAGLISSIFKLSCTSPN
jgi:hypothetical protein